MLTFKELIMTNRYRKYIFFLLPILTISCDKKIDLLPTDVIEASKAYRNLADVNLGLIGAYAVLSPNAITNTSLVTDEAMYPTENTNGGGIATHRWQIDGSNGTVTAAFGENYIAIDRANRALAALDIITTSPAEQTSKDQYRGELLALRAYCHFELIRNFASKYESGGLGVAYMEKSMISLPGRLSFEATIAKIKADLVAAKPLIPSTFNDRTRITKAAVSAIQARVALYEKNWDEAVTYSTEAINLLPLATKTQFPQIWRDQSDAEVFWKLKRAVAADGLLGAFYWDVRGFVLYAPSIKLVNQFDRVNDIRFPAYIRVDNNRGAGRVPHLVNKYAGVATVNLADVKLYRTGEMYLIRSEAYAEKNMLTESANDLNTLRAARINNYTSQAFTSKAQLIDALMNERFKELAFEGHRYFDLRRRNLPIVRDPADAINTLGAVILNPTDKGYIFPLPDSELRANPNMVQNPGY
jgi:hypothetical protein